MKRIPQLQPLSREHHLGLVTARHAKDCNDDELLVSKHWIELKDYLDNQMATHFSVEDDFLLQALSKHSSKNSKVRDLIETVAKQHKKLNQLASVVSEEKMPSAEQVKQLATVLYDHIRFEEREVFPLAELILSDEELDKIYEASSANVKRLTSSPP